MNHQLREEALPVFYRENKVFIDLSSLTFDDNDDFGTDLRTVILHTPTNWLRGIGDINLRALRRLKITDLFAEDGIAEQVWFRFRYERVKGKARILIQTDEGRTPLSVTDDAMEVDWTEW